MTAQSAAPRRLVLPSCINNVYLIDYRNLKNSLMFFWICGELLSLFLSWFLFQLWWVFITLLWISTARDLLGLSIFLLSKFSLILSSWIWYRCLNLMDFIASWLLFFLRSLAFSWVILNSFMVLLVLDMASRLLLLYPMNRDGLC